MTFRSLTVCAARVPFLKRFFHSEAGAITVDWVVLSASVILLCVFCLALVRISLLEGIAEIFSWVTNAGI